MNILVGGSAVFTALTGMNDLAAVWLLPVGVVIYTLTGGIKATILTDYVHTMVIYAMILTGLFVVYCRSSLIGSPDAMYDLLKAAAQRAPVPGNSGGEYLTMSSQSGVLLGVVFWCAVFGSTVDVQLFQKAIAANPASTLPGKLSILMPLETLLNLCRLHDRRPSLVCHSLLPRHNVRARGSRPRDQSRFSHISKADDRRGSESGSPLPLCSSGAHGERGLLLRAPHDFHGLHLWLLRGYRGRGERVHL